ncbi:unnamed protein product [Moneuplotes crassus]|uniref:Uncharacterized protein n=1 Tax=Euplotes crassus TaxID=5936 RepID=A0AAD1Y8S1_EUPCR|nr:unnamed protein product [Moneuplotes crassus]
MSSANKIQPKVFPIAPSLKLEKSLEDCDISDDVLSESLSKAPSYRVARLRKFFTNHQCISKETVCAPLNQDFSGLKKMRKFTRVCTSKAAKLLDERKASIRASEGSPKSLQSEISSLLQQLIIKKKKAKISRPPFDYKAGPSLTPMNNSSMEQRCDNFILTIGDIDEPQKAPRLMR